jgi:hypothetical protein
MTRRSGSSTNAVRQEARLVANARSLGLILAAIVCATVTVPAVALAGTYGFRPGTEGFNVELKNEDGTVDTQAGSHPFEYSTTTRANQENIITRGIFSNEQEYRVPAGGTTKDIEVSLPPGFVGDPGVTSQCPEDELAKGITFYNSRSCPPDTQLGYAQLELAGPTSYHFDIDAAVYNMLPRPGEPAEFGMDIVGFPVVLVPHVRTGSDYGINVKFTSIPEGFELLGGKLTLWGVPGDHAHDRYRGECLRYEGEELVSLCSLPYTGIVRPFLSLPTSCGGPLKWSAQIDSYRNPGVYSHAEVETPPMSGCDKLSFAPQIAVAPEPAQAASPSGLSVEITVPQTYDNPHGLAESNLKDTTVTLPAGVAVNPASADGLTGCSEEQVGLEDAAEATCPPASKVGTVEITSPLLTNALEGSIFLAQQGNLPGNGVNPFGSLIALYIVARDPVSGVLVKLAGEVKPDPVTGQLTTTFLNNPQVPFDTLKLSFTSGPRAALVNPRLCGNYTTTTYMTPYSGGASASPFWTFPIASGPQGSACTSSQGFKPIITMGTLSNQAGGFTPFSLTYGRTDADQNLARIQVKTPPGLLGTLSTVALCPEPQAAAGTCGAESLLGHVTVAVGAGATPFYVTGKVYLSTAYNGGQFGLSIVVPAVAGPYNLGTVVVRASVNVDPTTAALTVTSDPLPQILQGVPLLVRAVNVSIDRPNFMFNPTNCNPLAIEGTLSGALGAKVPFSEHFQVTNCAALHFKPKFTVSTSGHTSRKNGASLDAKLSYPTGPYSANIAKVKVDLPKQLPSRLSTLQKACPAAVFAADPATCPAGSVLGVAKATTPILPVQLTGPVYFVSHAGEAFPDLKIVLQGYGVRVDLTGSTFISKAGITSTTFKTIPDVPVSTFELYLPVGPDSALAANGNLCKSKLTMPTAFVAQNGEEIHQSTPIGLTGCPKARRASRARVAAKRARSLHIGHGGGK